MNEVLKSKVAAALLKLNPKNGAQMSFILHNKIRVSGSTLYDILEAQEGSEDAAFKAAWKLLWSAQDDEIIDL